LPARTSDSFSEELEANSRVLSNTDGWLATSSKTKRVLDMNRERGIERTIRGTIFPVEWDKNDNIVRVVIDTPDQDGYLIDRNRKGKELLYYVWREVEVSGTIRDDDGGYSIFKVKEYFLTKG
jgi:hypothetical protein